MESPEALDKTKLKENFETQLSELEMLQSVFYNTGEIHIDDYLVIADMTDYVKDKTNILPSLLDFTVKLTIESFIVELCVSLPHEYPSVEPEIFVRSSKQNRTQQHKLNTDVSSFISTLDRGEICVFSVITWLQDNALNYMQPEPETVKTENKNEKDNECARYWIYSHHIYSKIKRKEILNLADSYGLTGFCLPGKPGVICIEGMSNSCNDWWLSIKAMTWKKIVCKQIETKVNKDVDKFRKFKTFEEISLQSEGNRSNHMSMGDLNKYLELHNCAYIFKELFGLEGKSS